MSIVILKGTQQHQWDIDGSMKPGGVPIHFTDAQLKKHKEVVDRVLDEEVKKPLEEIEADLEEEKEESNKFTKEELFALNKAEQIIILNELGVTKIPRLESGRVNAILGAQK